MTTFGAMIRTVFAAVILSGSQLLAGGLIVADARLAHLNLVRHHS
jgi:hypothetical protein